MLAACGAQLGGGAVERWSCGEVELWRGGAVERWSCGEVELWRGGAVERWRGGEPIGAPQFV